MLERKDNKENEWTINGDARNHERASVEQSVTTQKCTVQQTNKKTNKCTLKTVKTCNMYKYKCCVFELNPR